MALEIHACVVAVIAVLALAVVPTSANAASPILEFVIPGHGFPTSFTAEGGPVNAVLADFEPVVNCTGSHGEGEITGPRSTVSHYIFTGCKAEHGSLNGQPCKSEGANSEEIRAENVQAELVFINQAKHEVGMLLNPSGGIYMEFRCGGELVKARGPFLAPVGPINQEATSFTASLSHVGALQIPGEYEGPNGEKLLAIPTGEREAQPPAKTGVSLSFTILPSASLEIKAVTAHEVEAKQRQEEAAAAKSRREEEAATKKRQEEETAAKKRQQEAQKKAHHQLTKALKQCRKVKSKHKRTRCEKRAKRKYASKASPYSAPTPNL